MKYLDLFAGMGGFHSAADNIKTHKLQFVAGADIAEESKIFYKNNYGKNLLNDVSDVLNIDEKIDIIFAGFPCQPFSSAGNRDGFNHAKGNLFWVLLEIIEKFKPKYILLENVRSLESHDNGNTWKIIKDNLSKLYDIPEHPIVISPTDIGFPEHRKRVYIPGVLKTRAKKVDWEHFFIKKNMDIKKYTDLMKGASQIHMKELTSEKSMYIDEWEKLITNIGAENIVRPIWGNYWFDNKKDHPAWKQKIVEKNKKFYKDNKSFIDAWMKNNNFKNWRPSFQKLEWNVSSKKYSSIYEGIIQFRPSGLRVKTDDILPTFVALNQTPFIGRLGRYLSVEEVAKIQGFKRNDFEGISINSAYKLVGNNVNVHTTTHILKKLLQIGEKNE